MGDSVPSWFLNANKESKQLIALILFCLDIPVKSLSSTILMLCHKIWLLKLICCQPEILYNPLAIFPANFSDNLQNGQISNKEAAAMAGIKSKSMIYSFVGKQSRISRKICVSGDSNPGFRLGRPEF